MWYIFDKDNNCVAIANCEPDNKDLATRNESAIQSELQLSIDQVKKTDDGAVAQKATE